MVGIECRVWIWNRGAIFLPSFLYNLILRILTIVFIAIYFASCWWVMGLAGWLRVTKSTVLTAANGWLRYVDNDIYSPVAALLHFLGG